MRLVIVGPQGSGKGTQAERLAALTGARHIATGDLVRAEIETHSARGQQIQWYNDHGELVPDETILALVRPILLTTSSWILDGFPRDELQARRLDELLATLGQHLDAVIVLVAPDADLIARIAGRRLSEATGKTYHLVFDPPPPSDPGPFVQRADDIPEDIQRRLEIYHTRTEPLKEYYARLGLVHEVNALGAVNEITQAIMHILETITPVPAV